MGVGPPSGNQPAVPGHQGGGRDTKGCPGRTRKESTEGGQQGAISGLVGTSPSLATEDCHFVTKCDQLDILGLLGAKEQESQSEKVTDS